MESDRSLQFVRGPAGGSSFLLLLITLAVGVSPACLFHRNRNEDLGAKSIAPGDQPDKVLFQKAQREIDNGRYDVGRLTLQVLINTYPDSEYLAKAKLLTASSFYKQGGVSGLTQAEAEYKDFITFFPTAPEAPTAEYLAGMCHFKLMGKADRDLSEARAAEAEFKIFLEKYPDNAMVPRVKGRLREVQEVLAEGNYETALLYYKRGANRAASSRLQEIADSYPSFSKADMALWYLGQTQEKLRNRPEAVLAYDRVMMDYPLSPVAKNAKTRLVALEQPVPKASKATLARARADQESQKQVHHNLLTRAEGLITSAPDLSATRHGPVVPSAHTATLAQTKGQTPGPTNASIVAEPLSDPASGTGAATPKSAEGSPGSVADPKEAAPPAPSSASPGSDGSAAPSDPSASASAPASSQPEPSAATAAAGSSTEPDGGSDPSPGAQPQASEKTAPQVSASNSQAPAPNKKSSDTDANSSSTAKKSKFHFLKKIIP